MSRLKSRELNIKGQNTELEFHPCRIWGWNQVDKIKWLRACRGGGAGLDWVHPDKTLVNGKLLLGIKQCL